LRSARRARSRSIVKVLSSVCMVCILPYSGLSVWEKVQRRAREVA
jgi:hypothetical protein